MEGREYDQDEQQGGYMKATRAGLETMIYFHIWQGKLEHVIYGIRQHAPLAEKKQRDIKSFCTNSWLCRSCWLSMPSLHCRPGGMSILGD